MELTLNQKLSLIQKEFKANKSKFNSFQNKKNSFYYK